MATAAQDNNFYPFYCCSESRPKRREAAELANRGRVITVCGQKARPSPRGGRRDSVEGEVIRFHMYHGRNAAGENKTENKNMDKNNNTDINKNKTENQKQNRDKNNNNNTKKLQG
ncbi:hypothetical protein EYF80_018022 [Liparis tanakae]|uniref:Uncharacterized protein n=1 Tax=Liparis tanakae TaxID=230148 RepID=A0A4Z2I1H5_9TELE|nr:hypothetical protein EYF80_018022 [Liparis tanakae]